METPVTDQTYQVEEILEKLTHLPAPLFEQFVIHFDYDNIIPSLGSAQSTRAIELVRLARSRENGITKLQEYLESKTNASHQIKINDLIGILMPPEEEKSEISENIARYVSALIKNSTSYDLFKKPDDKTIFALVWNLENLSVNPENCPEILRFAVMCHDYAAGLGQHELRNHLRGWLNEACIGTTYSLESIRALSGRQDYSHLHRLSVEIAWDKPISTAEKNNLQYEAYIRWGGIRQRIDQVSLSTDAHKEVASLLESMKEKEEQGAILVDHVELVIDPIEMHQLWEYKSRSITEVDLSDLQPFPIVVRSNQTKSPKNLRACPRHMVLSEHIACNKDGREQFLARIQDHGVFVATKYESDNEKPCTTVRDAISWASIGIWTRKTFDDDAQLRDVLTNLQVEDIPLKIHKRRAMSGAESIWRSVVVLFDPNLPPFKFSYQNQDSNSQHLTNKALKTGFQIKN